MKWHPEVLAQRQMRVLAEIGPTLVRHGFYLAGGTAVALHLGHRRSVDLDWFTSNGLDDPQRFAAELQGDGIPFHTDEFSPGTLHGSVRGVQVTLLRFRYSMVARLQRWPAGVQIAGRADLAAMKLGAIARRGAKKDFVDIFALGKRGATLQRMLDWYKKKAAAENITHVMRSLVYFDDADAERMPRMLWDVDWATIKDTIRGWVRKAAA